MRELKRVGAFGNYAMWENYLFYFILYFIFIFYFSFYFNLIYFLLFVFGGGDREVGGGREEAGLVPD